MSPLLSSSLAAGDADVCCMAPFTTATADGVDMAAYELAEGRQAVLWSRRRVEGTL